MEHGGYSMQGNEIMNNQICDIMNSPLEVMGI